MTAGTFGPAVMVLLTPTTNYSHPIRPHSGRRLHERDSIRDDIPVSDPMVSYGNIPPTITTMPRNNVHHGCLPSH